MDESWFNLSWINGFLIGFIKGAMGFIMTVYEFGRINPFVLAKPDD